MQAQHRPLLSLVCSKPSAAVVKFTVYNQHGRRSPHDVICGTGVAQPLQDVLSRVAGGSYGAAAGSLLLLGPPGVGKSCNRCIKLNTAWHTMFQNLYLPMYLPTTLCVPFSPQHLCVIILYWAAFMLLGPPGVGKSQHCLPPHRSRPPLPCIFLPIMLCVPFSLQHLSVKVPKWAAFNSRAC